MVAPVLIFAIGNESRGDDALGPLLLRELDAWLKANGLSDQFELLEDFQLQVEHAMDMQGRQLVLFIDAGMDTRAPFDFYRAQTSDTPVLYSHALAPEALLKVYAQFYQESPPDVFILCVCGERFELGDDVSLQAVKRLALAFEFGKKLLHTPEVAAWDGQCMQKSMGELMSREDNSRVPA
ncbi:MAG: hydrogenase maturation protease [Gallionellaceae bacterium]|jgi:hydrogenase maturation protease